MRVWVSFFGLQRELIRTDRIRVSLSEKIRIADDLFGYVRDRYPELSLKKDMVVVTVNNNATSLDHQLRADDEISFIPHIGGG